MNLMKNFAPVLGVLLPAFFIFSACSLQTSPSLLTADSNIKDVNKKVLTDVPFAYDLALDTISYNSCVGAGLNSSGNLHGLKIGANEGFVESNDSGAVKAGLKLRSEFLQYIAQNVDPTYPNTSVVPSQIQYILENSDINKEAMIQYAVRNKSNLTVVQDAIDQSKVVGSYLLTRDGNYENTVLSQDPVLTAITKNVKFGANKTVSSEGPRVYNLGTGSSPDPIETSLGYSSASDDTYPPTPDVDDGAGYGEQYSDTVRSKLNSGEYILTSSFGNVAQASSTDTTSSYGLNSPRRSDKMPITRAYGKSYELGFTTKSSAVPSQRRNIMNRVIEKNLDTGVQVAGASWSCENYVIMKTNQLNNKKATEPSCSELLATDYADATNGPALKAKVARLRRHYSDSQWAIGLVFRENTVYNPANRLVEDPATNKLRPLCLVNKAAECYLETLGLVTTDRTKDIGVNYNASIDGNTAECYLSRYRQMGVTYIGNKSGDTARLLGRCPQYASICVRTSTSY